MGPIGAGGPVKDARRDARSGVDGGGCVCGDVGGYACVGRELGPCSEARSVCRRVPSMLFISAERSVPWLLLLLLPKPAAAMADCCVARVELGYASLSRLEVIGTPFFALALTINSAATRGSRSMYSSKRTWSTPPLRSKTCNGMRPLLSSALVSRQTATTPSRICRFITRSKGSVALMRRISAVRVRERSVVST